MKKSNVVLGLLTLVGLGVSANYIYKNELKKTRKKKKVRKEVAEDVDDESEEEVAVTGEENRAVVGKINFDQIVVDSCEVEEERIDLSKKLFTAMAYSPEFDIDMLNPMYVVNGEGDGIIRITQEAGLGNLNLYIQFPSYPDLLKKDRNNPNVGDIIKSINETLTQGLESNEINPVAKKLVCTCSYCYTYNGTTNICTVDIPKWVYEEYSDGKRDGLTMFYESMKNKNLQESVFEKFNKYLWSFVPYKREEVEGETINICEVFISTKVVISNRCDSDAVLKLLKYLTDELNVSKGCYSLDYCHLIFHAPNDHEFHDFSHFYMLDSENNVAIGYN